jgi:hypothetical protein
LSVATVALLCPHLVAELERVNGRLTEIRKLLSEKKRAQIRKAEQLIGRKRLFTGMMFACRMALQCLVARPRTWKRWVIVESERSVFEEAAGDESLRAVRLLLQDNEPARQSMHELMLAVRQCEEVEIAARRLDPKAEVAASVSAALSDIQRGIEAQQLQLVEEQRAMHRAMLEHHHALQEQQRVMFDALVASVARAAAALQGAAHAHLPRVCKAL